MLLSVAKLLVEFVLFSSSLSSELLGHLSHPYHDQVDNFSLSFS